MKRLLLVMVLMFGTSLVAIQPADAGQYCADGWYSQSSGSGSCSWHGGIAGGSNSKINTYKQPAPVYKAPAPVYKLQDSAQHWIAIRAAANCAQYNEIESIGFSTGINLPKGK